MKTKLFFTIAAIVPLTLLSTQLPAEIKPTVIHNDSIKISDEALANSLILRLEEIKQIDKSKLESSEKKELRKEVRTIKSQLKEIHGGVYISVGALILILVLLIVLL